jgi:hypothetical protein
MNLYIERQADEDFNKARFRESLARIANLIQPSRQELLSLSEVKSLVKPKGEAYQGLTVVSIDKIVGSEGRYRDFNKAFLPKREMLRTRWKRVDKAHIQSVILPPIRLYEVGGVYFVRDGNHRVSVARSQGAEMIDAEVVKIDSEIKLNPGITREELKRRVVAYEKKLFEKETYFKKITGYDLEFTAPGRFDEIKRHINTHKYYMNQDQREEIPFDAALKSWFETVFEPIINIVEDEKLPVRFPGRTTADLYVWIVKHWDELKKKYGPDYSVKDAAIDFSERHGKGFWERLKNYFGFRKKKTSYSKGEDVSSPPE